MGYKGGRLKAPAGAVYDLSGADDLRRDRGPVDDLRRGADGGRAIWLFKGLLCAGCMLIRARAL